jgi:Nitrous oxide-stimulated promoter
MAVACSDSPIVLAPRRAREWRTVSAIVHMYCRAKHGSGAPALCEACRTLHDYAQRRLERCVFGDGKPTCAGCTVHCYKPRMREQMRAVMMWAGPRMLWRHPVLAIRHKLDGWRGAPLLRQAR